jgi:hypothetical protein
MIDLTPSRQAPRGRYMWGVCREPYRQTLSIASGGLLRVDGTLTVQLAARRRDADLLAAAVGDDNRSL